MKYKLALLVTLLVAALSFAVFTGVEAKPAKASSWYCYVSPYNFWNIYCWQTG